MTVALPLFNILKFKLEITPVNVCPSYNDHEEKEKYFKHEKAFAT